MTSVVSSTSFCQVFQPFFSRSFIVLMLWLAIRHHDDLFCGMVLGMPMWYHVGSCVWSWQDILRGVNCMLTDFTILSSWMVSWSSTSALFPFVGAFHICKKGLALIVFGMLVGADLQSRSLAMYAHVGLLGDILRYSFSHIMSITSFWALMLSKLIPPFSIMQYKVS
jgi:hypothetical protein